MRLFRFRRRRLNWRTRLGFVAFLFANLVHWLVARGTWPETNLTDFAQGLLFGVAIAVLLLEIRHQSRCPANETPLEGA